MEAIRTVDLTKMYKDVMAVDHVNLTIHQGELFSLLGVNGAGKTTMIKMLSCLTKPTSGDILVNERSSIQNNQAVKAIIAVSPQETAVAPNLTVQENLELMAKIHGHSKTATCLKIQQVMTQFSLQEIANKKAKKLSGGWQRRLSIAMALILEPQILFLDEPTLGLDVIARKDLWDIIETLKGKITILLTTHYMEEAEALSSRIGILKRGKLVFVGTTKEIQEVAQVATFEEAFIKLVREEN